MIQLQTWKERELQRTVWWEPYTWNRSGVGMSIPRSLECSRDYRIHRRKVKSVRIYGLEGKEFIPTAACLEFKDSYLIFDRGVHNTGQMRLIDMETQQSTSVTEWPYLLVYKEEKDRFTSPIDKDLLFPNTRPLEKRIEELEGAMVNRFILKGNDTLAVGLLANEVIITLSGQRYLQFGVTVLDRQDLHETLGNVGPLSTLYALITHMGKIKATNVDLLT